MRSLIRKSVRNQNRRPGIVTLELILWLPIMIILLLAVIEFAIIMQVNKQVAYASRFGAKLASEITRAQATTPNLGNFNLTATANNLKTQVDIFLANAGLTASCQVLLEHTACVPTTSQTDPVGTPCPCGASPTTLAANETVSPFDDEAYVKVTVCVPLLNNVPNVLSTFGFDVTGKTLEHSTVFRIETNNLAPTTINTADSSAGTPAGTVITPALPTTSNLLITVPNGTATNDTFTIDFNANSTTDTESPFASLSFDWATAGVGVSPAVGAGATFTVTFTVPGTMGDLIQTDANSIVALTATDPCNDNQQDSISVTVRRLATP
jgi:Flp pilus assembly protein TadG